MNKNSSLVFRSCQTSVINIAHETNSSCANVMKKAHEISFNEAFRLQYRLHERNVENFHTDTTEKE